MDLHWLGFMGLGVAALFVVSFYYVLLRGFGVLLLLSHASLMLLFVVYTFLFLVGDFSLAVVYHNSHSGLPWYYRVAGSWSNGGGSFLLFSSLTSLTFVLLSTSSRVREGRVVQAGFVLVSLSGLTLAFVNGVFERVHGVVEGLGLNPLLVNPWVYPHPIATFLSYSLIACSTILAITNLDGLSRVMASASWVALTAALAFGGLWSYETLGWGGYWAWDPVEVAQLTPWLLLTASLHSLAISQRLYQALMAVSLASVYYSFLVVRAGLSPLHSFASPQAYTASVSLLAIVILLAIAFFKVRDLSLEVKGLKGYATLASMIAPLYSASVLVGALTPSLLSNLAGLGSLTPPAFDTGVMVYTTLLAPVAIIALVLAPIPFTPGRLHRVIILLGATVFSLALTALLATGYTYAGKSGFYSNTLGLSLVILATYTLAVLLASATLLAYRRMYRLSLIAAQHALLALTLVGIVLSAPYAYNQDYFETLKVKVGGIEGDFSALEAYYNLREGYINLSQVLAMDKALLDSTLSLIRKATIEAINLRVAIDASKELLRELGLEGFTSGVWVGDLGFEVSGAGLVWARNSTLKLKLLEVGNATLIALEVVGFFEPKPGDGLYNISKPLRFMFGDVNLTVSGLIVVGDVAIVRGVLRGPSYTEIPLLTTSGLLKAYRLYTDSGEVRELYSLSPASNDLNLTRINRCLDNVVYCSNVIPELIPRVLEFNVKLRTPGGLGEVMLRYDIGGEIAGVKGLVPRSYIARSGLSDHYIAVYPRIVDITRTVTVTEAEIAYLSEASKNLGEEGKLALTTLLVTSRLRGELGDPRAVIELNPLEYMIAILKLYNETRNWGGTVEEVTIRVKTIPYIWILWIGITLTLITQTTLTGIETIRLRKQQRGEA